MGGLDSIAGIMQTFATNYLDGSLVIMYVCLSLCARARACTASLSVRVRVCVSGVVCTRACVYVTPAVLRIAGVRGSALKPRIQTGFLCHSYSRLQAHRILFPRRVKFAPTLNAYPHTLTHPPTHPPPRTHTHTTTHNAHITPHTTQGSANSDSHLHGPLLLADERPLQRVPHPGCSGCVGRPLGRACSTGIVGASLVCLEPLEAIAEAKR